MTPGDDPRPMRVGGAAAGVAIRTPARFRLTPAEERVCPGCGRTFTVTRKHLKQKTCSVACGVVARPKRERYVWTDAADDVVRKGYERGDPVSEIAARLGRTTVAVAVHAKQALGLRHRNSQRTLAEQFMDHVAPEPNSGCWLWIGSIDHKGYGGLRVAGELKRATHVSLAVAGTFIPAGMCVLHRCDVPACVNPDHLFVGTLKDNTQDMIRKGRGSKPPPSTPGRGAKELCGRGHPMSGGNLYLSPKGARRCCACMNLRKAETRARFIAMGLRCDGIERRDGR